MNMANGGIRQVAATIEETGLLGDLGLPEIDQLIPTPAAVFKQLGLPTPGDFIKSLQSAVTGNGGQQPAQQPAQQQPKVEFLPAPLPFLPPLPLPPMPGQPNTRR